MIKLNFLSAALVSAGVLTLAGGARAQDAGAAPAPASAATAAKTADASTKKGSNREVEKLEAIVVTANKRLESSSKVAASVAAIGSNDLTDKGVTSASKLTDEMPNIQIGQGNLNGMEITIRGIGSSSNTEVGDPEAAFHVDGIYIGRPQGAQIPFFDLDRVEVLRGPQGTLYGRNANAGAINVISKRPDSLLAGAVDADIGNYNAQKFDAMVNVPLTSGLAVRAVVSSVKHDGYTKSPILGTSEVQGQDDQDSKSGRISALLKISPTTSWLLIADGYQKKGAGAASMPLANGQPASTTTVSSFLPQNVNDQGNGLTSELKAGLGAVSLTYLYGHRYTDSNDIANSPTAGILYHLTTRFKQDSHELRFSNSKAGPLEWVAGLYYYKETGHTEQRIYLPVAPTALGFPPAVAPLLSGPAALCAPLPACTLYQDGINGPSIVESKAVFGQGTYSVAPDWRAVVGLRYNKDARSRIGQTITLNNFTGPAKINDASVSGGKTTYKLGIEHDLSATRMAYATISTGYKSGGFNDGNEISPTTPGYKPNLYFNPEEITAYEAGVKGRFWDGNVRLGASVFYYDYSNLQVASVIGSGAGLVQLTSNAAKATVSGAEFEGVAVVGESGRVNFGLGLLDSKYKQYTTAGGTDYSGHPLDRAPRVTLSLGYTHDWELSGGALFSAYVGTRYTSSYQLTDPGTPTYGAIAFTQQSTTKSSVVLTYAGRDDRWKIQAYVNNIENKRQMPSLSSISKTAEITYLTDPRTMGLRGSYQF